MKKLQRILFVSLISVGTLAAFAGIFAQQSTLQASNGLGVEVLLKEKPFYFPAATAKNNVTAYVRVQSFDAGRTEQKQISAVKFMPRMENDKVSVSVYALYGDTSAVKNCEDWKELKESLIGVYVAGEGEKVQLASLRDANGTSADEALTFQIVPKKAAAAPVALNNPGGGTCECGTCGGLTCCPKSGFCLGCGSCGDVCCAAQLPD